MNKIKNQNHKTFEDIRQKSKEGRELWSARDLMPILEYNSWDKFKSVIHKAIKACDNSDIPSLDHFFQIKRKVSIGSDAKRYIPDYHLSRYACYLIVQNGDPTKPVIAHGQSYFALQTRKQELADDLAFQQLDENKKRIFLRKDLKEHNKQLVGITSKIGVKSGLDFAIFQNHGYKGLYGGLDAKDIHKKKKLKKSQHILDHMGSTELAANLFRATQAEEKLIRNGIKDKEKANRIHYEVGKKVRQTIKDLQGRMPEELPTPKTSVKSLEKQHKKQIRSKKRDSET